jgi:Ca2+-binding EF-hand superfamily protein
MLQNAMSLLEQNIHPEKAQQLRAAFALFDMNGDGLISFSELRRSMKIIGEKKTIGELRRVIASIPV